jgi:hypothetical protein
MDIKAELNKSVDEILKEILADYRAQDSSIETGEGSMVYIGSTTDAAAKWGIYHGIKYAMRQIFPHMAEEEYLERHGGLRNLTREAFESKSNYLGKYLNDIRNPEGAGSTNDHETWAKKITNVKAAFCNSISAAFGTVQVIVIADEAATGSEVPSNHTTVAGTATSIVVSELNDSAATFQTNGVMPGDVVVNGVSSETALVVTVDSEIKLTLDTNIFTVVTETYTVKSLCTQVKSLVYDKVTPNLHPSNLDVIGPIIQTEAVTMTITGSALNLTLIKNDIEAVMNAMKPGEVFYLNQLVNIAMKRGASDVTITEPAANVVPGSTTMVRPGVVSVTPA